MNEDKQEISVGEAGEKAGMKSKNPEIFNKLKKNPWILATCVLGIIIVILFILLFNSGITGGAILGGSISEEEAGDRILEFAKLRGVDAELIKVEDQGDLYSVTISIRGQQTPVYLTKDGEYFVSGVTPIVSQATQPAQQQQPSQPANVPKSDKPEVELFVMTHCPYGTQAEKGIIPVLELLGDEIDAEIRFVHYFMHDPEEDETPIQICIREEQPDKWLDYLKCFLEDGDTERCLTETKISKGKLNSCVEKSAKEYYESDSGLSEGYGVRGSPTLIINGQQVSSGRNPSAYLSTICSAFNKQPEKCNEQISSQDSSPGFGYTASAGGSTNAQC